MKHDLQFRQRLIAGRTLAGLRSAEALADAIDEEGLKAKVIRGYEQGIGAPSLRNLRAIARSCGLPVEWFVADFERLPEIAPADAEAALRDMLARTKEVAEAEKRKRRQAAAARIRPRGLGIQSRRADSQGADDISRSEGAG